MGLAVYELIPDFRERCPLCDGAGCAVRHGLYYRRVVDLDGVIYRRFPVPRFLCRSKGPRRGKSRTFSVLPVALVPRRSFSLPLMLWLLELVLVSRRTVRQTLDQLAQACRQPSGPLCPDEVAVYRLLELFCRAYQRLQSFPLPAAPLAGGLQSKRQQARALCRLLSQPCRGSPFQPLLDFQQRYFPNRLLDLKLS